MAQIKEELLLVKVSTIHRNDAGEVCVLNDEIASTIEQVVAELIGEKAIVEIEILKDNE